MVKPVIRILQIGDIHFPNAMNARPVADIKRDPFSISSEAAPQGMLIQKITQHLSHYEAGYFDAIAFMGDFTSGSPNSAEQIRGLVECADYLDRNVVRQLLGRHCRDRALFVPGNHDVDRTQCPSKPGERLKKFDQYQAALATHGQLHVSLDKPSRIDIGDADAGISLFGINTCIGCGEYLSFPDKTKTNLANQLTTLLKRGSASAAKDVIDRFLDLTERLDAPLILQDVLNELDGALDEQAHSQPHYVPVVVGHHNLLPQFQLRVAPFSELMNSGQLRSALSAKNRPICYLHGHIHADPIEVIFNQAHPDGFIVSISAPQYPEGYNVVELHFDDTGAPLGVVVSPVIQDKQGNITKARPRRVSFRQGRHRVSALTDVAREIFYGTFSKNQQLHISELHKLYPKHPPETIERAVLELEWLELVEINNRERGAAKWNVASAL